MKTKELIDFLNKLDPTGELDVVVNSTTDICDVFRSDMYYEGSPFIAHPGDGSYPKYMTVSTRGEKINLELINVSDLILDNPDFPVIFKDEDAEKHYKPAIISLRKKIKKYDKVSE